MTRLVLTALATLMLAACQQQIPDSGQGVGFENYSDYMARRDRNLGLAPAAAPLGSIMPEAVTSGPIGSSPIATSGAAAYGQPVYSQLAYSQPAMAAPLNAGIPGLSLDPNRPVADTVAGVNSTATPIGGGNRGISDEQNFDAVSSRESIASDAARIRQQREQYVVVQPTALPTRTADTGPNIVQYAVSTSHAPGTRLHSRMSLFAKDYATACSAFTSADAAQQAFLAQGGPSRDRLGVDPDGDGFACGWDPRPFRAR